MRLMRAFLIWGLVVPGAMIVGSAHAQHVRFGIVFGVPWPWYYPAPYYPPTIVVQQPAPAYVEQAQPETAQPRAYWYYCADAKNYYPYVRQCPGGWQAVPAGPPPPERAR